MMWESRGKVLMPPRKAVTISLNAVSCRTKLRHGVEAGVEV